MRLVWADVTAIEMDGGDVQRLSVALDDPAGEPGVALCYPALTGRCALGERVLCNTTAVDLALGTGGVHVVAARAGTGTPRGVAVDAATGGHIMKLRYTPLQCDVRSVEEQDAPGHATMATARVLGGMPVVCCGLHSQVPLVAAAVKRDVPAARIAYVMTDEAALPIALSESVRASRAAGLLDTTLTCGQAFGGESEAVTLHSALLAARHVSGADVAIVAIGPGVVGTATPLGHGGVAQGEAINAASCLGGRPVAVLRVSFADARERHRVLSHHTIVALTVVALAPAAVAVPSLAPERASLLEKALDDSHVWDLHRRADARAAEIDLPDLRGVQPRTMGRGPADDPAFFAAACAAGEVAASLIA